MPVQASQFSFQRLLGRFSLRRLYLRSYIEREREREREREKRRERKWGGSERHYISGGARNISDFEGSQAVPLRPSGIRNEYVK
jgi:hypothetical protein